MSRIRSVLDVIVERSGLDRLEGHPLYAYKVTQAEQDDLQAALKDAMLINPELKQQEQRAAFCLFGAEWFRRHHEEGPWSWDTILEGGLGLSGHASRAFRIRVRKITTDGLRWWRVPPVQTAFTTQYLVTLACQGGLPLKTLRNHGTPLRRFLKKVLKHHERYPQERLSDVVDENSGILPRTLNNEGVRALAIRIVECVSNLRRLTIAVDNTDGGRAGYLDQHHPGWRDRIPMRIDDPEALELVLGLLDQEVTHALPAEGFAVTTTVIRQGNPWKLTRDLAFESTISEEALWNGLELESADTLPPKMSLYLSVADLRVRVASVTRKSNSNEFTVVRVPAPPLSGPNAAGSARLVATAGSHVVTSLVVPGGEALPDSPWVFSTDDPAELIGTGATRTRRPAVLVAVSNAATWAADEESICELLEDTVCGRRLLKVSGTAMIYQDETVVQIRTRAESENAAVFKLSGRIRKVGPNGSEVWLGVPTITEYPTGDGGVVNSLDKASVQWKRSGGVWQPLSPECVGDVLLRVDRDGQTIFQSQATIFPESFDYRIRPNRNNEGELDLTGLGNVEVIPAAQPNLTVEVVHNGTSQSLRVMTIPAARPASFPVRIVFASGGRSEIRVSCPTTGIAIVDATGEVVSPDLPIPLDRLDGLTLHATTADNAELLLVEQGENRLLGPLKEIGSNSVREFSLAGVQNYVRSLLARSDNPDHAVTLLVERPPWAMPQFRFSISRYPGRLEKEKTDYSATTERPDFTDVTVATETLKGLRLAADDLKVEVVPLGEPDQQVPGESIQRVGESTWRIHHELLTPGGYLVTAWANEYTCLRPLRVSVNMNLVEQAKVFDVEAVEQFDAALNTFDGADRRLQWDQFAGNLAIDPGHPGWVKMDALVNATEQLPVTTFEAIAALTRNSETAALLGLRKFRSAWLWDKLEELPFLWSMVPVRSWVAATTRYVGFLNDRLQALGCSRDEITSTINTTLDGFSALTPLYSAGMSGVVACLYVSGLDIPLKHVAVQQLRPVAANELLTRRQSEMNRLIDEHNRGQQTTQHRWPSPRLPVTPEVHQHLMFLQITRFPNEWAVLNAPAIAAIYCVYDIPRPDELVLQLQQLRGIDIAWYDCAFAVALSILAGRRLSENRECFCDQKDVD